MSGPTIKPIDLARLAIADYYHDQHTTQDVAVETVKATLPKNISKIMVGGAELAMAEDKAVAVLLGGANNENGLIRWAQNEVLEDVEKGHKASLDIRDPPADGIANIHKMGGPQYKIASLGGRIEKSDGDTSWIRPGGLDNILAAKKLFLISDFKYPILDKILHETKKDKCSYIKSIASLHDPGSSKAENAELASSPTKNKTTIRAVARKTKALKETTEIWYPAWSIKKEKEKITTPRNWIITRFLLKIFPPI